MAATTAAPVSGSGDCSPNPCTSCTPARPVPADRWGSLEPRSILGDSTDYTFHYELRCGQGGYRPFWFDLVMQGGRMFTVTGSTFEVWDAQTTPGQPPRLSTLCEPVLKPAGAIWKKTDQDFYATSVAAPPTSNDLVVIGLEGGMGLSVIDTSNPQSPFVRYQDEGALGATSIIRDVHATRIGGRDYAFAVNQDLRVYIYDLQSVRETAYLCFETETDRPCSTLVFKGALNGMNCPSSDGSARCSLWMIAGVDEFLLLRWGQQTKVWDVAPRFATPQEAPRLVTEFGPNPQAFDAWKQGGTLYVAVSYGQEVRIYSIPCAAAGSCAPVLQVTLSTPGGLLPTCSRTAIDTVEVSQDGGRTYLYAGSKVTSGFDPQHEYLFDISNLSQPDELTPQVHPDGYWGWYYPDNPTGFRNVAGYRAVISNNHLYRAAWSVLDVHELIGNRPPVAGFNLPPPPVYGGALVHFTDTSIGGPTSWAWDFDGDEITDSTVRHPDWPVPAAGPYPRVYPVTLTVCNPLGCDDDIQNLTVQDPDSVRIVSFRAQLFCVAGLCEADVGQTITFFHQIEGVPDFYDYDWDGDGTFEDANHATPVTTYAYESRGSYRPVLRARGPSSVATYVHLNLLIILPLPLPSFDFESGNFDGWSAVIGAAR